MFIKLLQTSGVLCWLTENPLTLAAYHREVLVGAIACRLEAHGTSAKMYIVTLGVLAPYRGMRVGESAVNYIHHIPMTSQSHRASPCAQCNAHAQSCLYRESLA